MVLASGEVMGGAHTSNFLDSERDMEAASASKATRREEIMIEVVRYR